MEKPVLERDQTSQGRGKIRMKSKQRLEIFCKVYTESMRRFGFDFRPGHFYIVTTLIVIASVAIVTSAVIGVISAFTPPKPAKISFGLVGGDQGPRYGSFGPLDNTVSNEIAVPVLYGELKIAGNVIWQTDPGQTVSRIIGLCEGQINAISDVRANDQVISAGNTPGSDYTAYLGTATQKADSRLPADLRPDLEMHNLAYIALTLTAGENIKGGNPTITSVCQGMLVETWNGSAWVTTKAYSRNPAACVRDFIINTRYGLGLAKANLNDTAFGDIYDYCEQMVDVPTGGQEARYRLDYVIDNQRPANDVLNDMLATFGGFLVYAGSKIKLRCEKIETITQYFGDGSTTKQNATFDPNNIVKDSMSWNFPSVDDKPNRVRVQWVDPSQNYVKVYSQVDDRIDQDDRGIINPKDISILGITRATQASRMAKLFLARTKYAAVNVQFATRLESIQCEIGDVVAVTHQSAKYVRKLFRISDMQESENEMINLVCSEYNPSIYDDRQGAAILIQQQPSGPNLYAPLDDVTSLVLLEDNFKQKDGVFATNILVSWDALDGDQILRLDHHLIQISQDGGTTYRDAAFASAFKTSYRIPLGNVQTGTTFTVRVKTVSDRGAESVGASGEVTIEGKVTPPSDVEDFSVIFAFDHLAMSWSSIDDEDLFGYEIRVGNANSTWETATIVTTEVLGTTHDLFNFTRGAKKFFIKAIDNSANYSEHAAVDTITITDIPESNVVVSFDLWSRVTVFPHPLQGTLSSDIDRIPTNNYDPTYNRITFQPKTDLSFLERQQAAGTYTQLQASSFKFGMEDFVTTEESYETQPIDLGSIFNADVIIDLNTFSSSNLGFVSVQISTSTDGITYTDYVTYVAGQYQARYIKLKILIQATDVNTRVRLIGANLTVDVPDRYQRFTNQAVTALGTTFNLSGFTSVKAIVITTNGAGVSLSPDVSDRTNLPNSFTVKLYDKTDTPQSGSVDIYVSGY